MQAQTIADIQKVIAYIEANLDSRLSLEAAAETVHYSKYYLHRIFTEAAGMTLYRYAQRRRLTEAARLLIFSKKPVLDIALTCGYESQQSFSAAFKAMYKQSPAGYRQRNVFYPLQLPFTLLLPQWLSETAQPRPQPQIRLARTRDIPNWMALMRLAIDGYPALDERLYLKKLNAQILKKQALILKQGPVLMGTLAFSRELGAIEYWAMHPLYRRRDMQKLFLGTLQEKYLPGREITITTYRQQDKADTGYREALLQLGFTEGELLTEFGYPTQRFVLAPEKQEGKNHA